MMKVLENGLSVCLSCGEGLDGALINYYERGETEPDCDFCGAGEGESDDVETVSWSSSNPTGERGQE